MPNSPYFHGGPHKFEVDDVIPDASVELTDANTTSNPDGFCAQVEVDVDPDAKTVSVVGYQGCTTALVDVHLTSTDLGTFTPVGTGDIPSDPSAWTRTITGGPGDWDVKWESIGDQELTLNGTAVFAYTAPAASPTPTPTPAPSPGSALSLKTSHTPHLRGHQMSIDVSGFTPGETYRVKISGVVVGHGTADATGQIHRKVRVPLLAHRPKAKLVVKGTQHRVNQRIRILNGIAK